MKRYKNIEERLLFFAIFPPEPDDLTQIITGESYYNSGEHIHGSGTSLRIKYSQPGGMYEFALQF